MRQNPLNDSIKKVEEEVEMYKVATDKMEQLMSSYQAQGRRVQPASFTPLCGY